ncbi:hypothetical protein AAG906_018437 [Vitis piasezkii]|uniref:Auxin-responsive protein SAUR32 n=2 Tax=Vitis vinifera TaxID=29760 RepID=A0A438J7F7_VITVI|nr:auxin-responsive protein SAUR40-like [Vitis riparia]XP_034694784.1 auxin-responsive protein SAUR40-like [Vitis riparia]RVW60283.1 Auxin-responsive protein SAUR32 [Vitis vinifera]RVX04894.1 Auxin-responsive protein SAUR32 [Vitis vinifera]WJZ93092.1 hypothetical protein VitviT2T_012054 [Vitis vinifera]|eukprot:XP_003632616.2 PREDICTED: auxin-responsive protein SAUR40 [Vitis vinifera]
MSDAKRTGEESRGLMKLEHFIRKLQLVLSLVPSKRMVVQDDVEYDEELEAATMVPDDVKEGHFAVWAVMGGEPKRFIVDLCYLTNPAFLRLLEQAEEEYGFEQKGTLAVPCQPEELQKILQPRREPTAMARRWATCKL